MYECIVWHPILARIAMLGLLFSVYAASGLAAETSRPDVASMLRGPGAQVDPQFRYYQNRSAESIAAEVAANGYKHAHYVATADSDIRGDLVRAFQRERLPVWYLTFCHVAYSTKDFPEGWEAWRMKLRASKGEDYVRLCMNDPGYIAFKRSQVAEVMRRHPFDGVELVEPFWPDVPGPERDTYGCLCEDCRAAFLRDHPEETDIPEFTDAASERYYKRQPELYRKWVEFRVRSIGRFLNAVLSDVRRERPNVPVMVWTLVQDDPAAIALMREAQGNDVAALVSAVRPDAVCLQTNWMDWMKPVLAPDYLRGYRPFVERLRSADPDMPYVLQVDTGSHKPARRSMEWLREADGVARSMGALGTLNYEYFITQSMYDDPPRLAEVRRRDGGVTLVFQKRVDTGRAVDTSNYRVTDAAGKSLVITGAKADGNLVLLGVRGMVSGREYTLRIEEVRDTPDRWLFPGHPAHTVRALRRTFTIAPARPSK